MLSVFVLTTLQNLPLNFPFGMNFVKTLHDINTHLPKISVQIESISGQLLIELGESLSNFNHLVLKSITFQTIKFTEIARKLA